MKQRIKEIAQNLGFELVGVAPAEPLIQHNQLLDGWLEKGHQGTMDWMQNHLELRKDPKTFWPPAQSILMLGMNYLYRDTDDYEAQTQGVISRYARGRDYHKVLRKLCKRLVREVESEFDCDTESRICVDSAPFLERAYAARAGLGWLGKNTCLIHPRLGSYFFLCGILWNLELEPDEPIKDHCGSCRACLDACPTNAFIEPHELDSRRCISYHTIELRDDIPDEFHEAIGTRIFGCDVCQDVCPFNRKAKESQIEAFKFRDAVKNLKLSELKALTEEEFNQLFAGSAIRRTKHKGFLRNVEIAIANSEKP